MFCTYNIRHVMMKNAGILNCEQCMYWYSGRGFRLEYGQFDEKNYNKKSPRQDISNRRPTAAIIYHYRLQCVCIQMR